MARSLGISRLDAFPTDVITQTIELYLSEDLDEPAIAGWLLVAESLVPILFDAVIPAFARAGADTTYLSARRDRRRRACHLDDYARRSRRLAPDGSESIAVGMAEAWDETIRVPRSAVGGAMRIAR